MKKVITIALFLFFLPTSLLAANLFECTMKGGIGPSNFIRAQIDENKKLIGPLQYVVEGEETITFTPDQVSRFDLSSDTLFAAAAKPENNTIMIIYTSKSKRKRQNMAELITKTSIFNSFPDFRKCKIQTSK